MLKDREIPVLLKERQRAKALFGDWQEAILWACLQNVMGEIYVDDPEKPGSAMAVLGDFCFLAGVPDRQMLLYPMQSEEREFLIMIPKNRAWAESIEESYGERARAVTRHAIKKEKDVFDRGRLKEAVASLNPEYRLKSIDEAVYRECLEHAWSRDLVSQFKDYEMYQRLGLGVAVYHKKELVAGASSYARYREGIEIEIDTREDHRRKGLAYACGAALIQKCLDRGLYPSWDAQNPGSAALAEKLGYHYDREYAAYEICRQGTA